MDYSNKIEIIITPGGAFRATTSYQPIDINAGIINQLGSSVVRKHVNLIPGSMLKNGPSRPINLSVGASSHCWSVELDELQINTTFATTSGGGLIYPAFNDNKLPQMTVAWKVPTNMRLVLGVLLNTSNCIVNQYFVAADNSGRLYILPLGNIYEDGRLCSGRFDEDPSSSMAALSQAWSQFNTSRWQSDLYNAELLAATQAMFAFKVEKEKFTQILPADNTADWTRYCKKFAHDAITTNLVFNNTKSYV